MEKFELKVFVDNKIYLSFDDVKSLKEYEYLKGDIGEHLEAQIINFKNNNNESVIQPIFLFVEIDKFDEICKEINELAKTNFTFGDSIYICFENNIEIIRIVKVGTEIDKNE